MDLEVPRSIRGGGTNKISCLAEGLLVALTICLAPRGIFAVSREVEMACLFKVACTSCTVVSGERSNRAAPVRARFALSRHAAPASPSSVRQPANGISAAT